MDGLITNIQFFSLHDGPGIRTTVFLKGCNLNCRWCHNPEAIVPEPELFYFAGKCVRCGACLPACTQGAIRMTDAGRLFDRERCIRCGACAQRCHFGALCMTGKRMTAEEVLAEVEKDKPFYETSGGGVTFSGGEPLLQPEFLAQLLAGCRARGIHTAVDTAGNVPWEVFERILPDTGLFLFDIKTADPDKHRQVTGVDNTRIQHNAEQLLQNGARVWIRIPVIPGLNDDVQEMTEIAALIAGMGTPERVELLPYHALGSAKCEALGREYELSELAVPTSEKMQELARILVERGLTVKLHSVG